MSGSKGAGGAATKTCLKCPRYGRVGIDLDAAAFSRNTARPDGLQDYCKECQLDAQRERRAKIREERLRDDYQPLKPDDFAVGIGNVPDRHGGDTADRGRASEEKRQEYNRRMGQVAAELHERWTRYLDGDQAALDSLSPEQVSYLIGLSEQERRFGNRRLARSASISLAHELLGIRMWCKAVEQWMPDRIVPTGWAARPKSPPETGKLDRTVHVILSDLHLGADLRAPEHPVPFGRIEETRRLASVVRQVLEYKPQYRSRTRLMVHLVGDVIQGMLMHDIRDGAPLTEQGIVFTELMMQSGALFAQEFPLVEWWMQPGNHGRDKLRHPGRATSFKWDGHEWRLYYGLSVAFRALKNTRCHLPLRAASLIDVYGMTMADTHSDTEILIKSPTRNLEANLLELQKINATRALGRKIDAWNMGHWHYPILAPGDPTMVYNGALIPPDGHARSMGYISAACGQWIYESVPGHIVGDARLVTVGPEQDADASLDAILRAPRLEDVALD